MIILPPLPKLKLITSLLGWFVTMVIRDERAGGRNKNTSRIKSKKRRNKTGRSNQGIAWRSGHHPSSHPPPTAGSTSLRGQGPRPHDLGQQRAAEAPLLAQTLRNIPRLQPRLLEGRSLLQAQLVLLGTAEDLPNIKLTFTTTVMINYLLYTKNKCKFIELQFKKIIKSI